MAASLMQTEAFVFPFGKKTADDKVMANLYITMCLSKKLLSLSERIYNVLPSMR